MTKDEIDDVYDPGLLWLTSPYYVKMYGYDIIPELNWDDEEYEGPNLEKRKYQSSKLNILRELKFC